MKLLYSFLYGLLFGFISFVGLRLLIWISKMRIKEKKTNLRRTKTIYSSKIS